MSDMKSILETLRDSADIRKLPPQALDVLAREIREKIIGTISVNGGHFGGPMGVVELAIALHHAFDFPHDRLIWDVGHQIYPHKLLTGRFDRFHSLRLEGGLTGYPAPEESPHDLFTTAHAGTAASQTVGLAVGDALMNRNAKAVAVVGDGAMSAGVAYEALNHAGILKRQMLIILNDNSMSIDKSVGALAELLDRIRTTEVWTDIKKSVRGFLEQIPLVGRQMTDVLGHLKDGIKATIGPHQIFEPLGFKYIGPVDGHDLPGLIDLFGRLKHFDEPVLLHVHTQKGRGFDVANPDPLGFHALTPFEIRDGIVERKPNKAANPPFTDVFSRAIVDAGAANPRVTAITAAMPDGTGLLKFRDRFPDRYFDVGICEQHGVAFAAGLAKAGLRPVAAIYSTFLQRAFDQIFHEVSLQNLPVVFAMDRAGMVGSDGPTHHGLADIAYLRPWPNLVLCAPADAGELNECLNFGITHDRAVAFRYPRDEALASLVPDSPPFELGKAHTLRTGHDAVLIAYGVMTVEALKAADLLQARGLRVGVINARFAKPLDEATIGEALAEYPLAFTIEDHFLTGGFGSAVLEFAETMTRARGRIVRLGSPDRFTAHAARRRQLEWVGLTAEKIADRVFAEVGARSARTSMAMS